MRSPSRTLILTFVFAAFLVAACEVDASTVRGLLVRVTPQGRLPAAGIPVTVYRTDIGRSGVAYAGRDGMYYLFNIPPGSVSLEIWVYPNSPPMTFQIQVFNQPFTDIGPITVP